jgi:hypothetical protein
MLQRMPRWPEQVRCLAAEPDVRRALASQLFLDAGCSAQLLAPTCAGEASVPLSALIQACWTSRTVFTHTDSAG